MVPADGLQWNEQQYNYTAQIIISDMAL